MTGEIVCWLRRTERGGINMGWVYPEGHFALVEMSGERQPREQLGETITATVIGWVEASHGGSIEFNVPDDPGVYVLVEQ